MSTRNYKPEVTCLLFRLATAGISLVSASNGGDADEDFYPEHPEKFVEELTATDEARLLVRMPDGRLLGLYLVYGNEPGELVADYHVNPLLESVVTAHSAAWEGRPQPMES